METINEPLKHYYDYFPPHVDDTPVSNDCTVQWEANEISSNLNTPENTCRTYTTYESWVTGPTSSPNLHYGNASTIANIYPVRVPYEETLDEVIKRVVHEVVKKITETEGATIVPEIKKYHIKHK